MVSASYSFAQKPAEYQIVSDFDDTIKITNVQSSRRAICQTLLRADVFSGMPELYRQYKSHGAKISIVSSGVIHLKALMYDDLKKNKIPYDQIFMRHFFAQSTLDFKYSKLIEVQKQNPVPMVLIGDDTQLDPDVYSMYIREYPSAVHAAYIRKVTGRALPGRLRTFHTPYEIGVYEYLEGRISFSELNELAEVMLAITNREELFPAHVMCPKNQMDFIRVVDISYDRTKLFMLTSKVVEHILRLCN